MELQNFEITIICTLFGLLLGLIVSRTKASNESNDLQQKINDLELETEAKETEIAGELYESLYNLHDGLVQTVRSYDSALKTVLDKLPTPNEKLAKLNQSAPKPLSLMASVADIPGLSGQIDILEEESFGEKTSEFRAESDEVVMTK